MRVVYRSTIPKNIVENIIYEVYITDDSKEIPYLGINGMTKMGRLHDSEHISGFIKFLKAYNKDYSPLKQGLPVEISDTHQLSIYNYISGIFVNNYLTKSKNASGIETAVNIAQGSKTIRVIEDKEGNKVSELDLYSVENKHSVEFIKKYKDNLKKELLNIHMINNKYNINILTFLIKLYTNSDFNFTNNFLKSEQFYKYNTGTEYTAVYSNDMKDLVRQINLKDSKERRTLIKIVDICKKLDIIPKYSDVPVMNKDKIEEIVSDVLVDNIDIIKLVHKDISMFYGGVSEFMNNNEDEFDLYDIIKNNIHCIENIYVGEDEKIEYIDILKKLNFISKGIKAEFDSNGILVNSKNKPVYFNLGTTTQRAKSFRECLYHKSGEIFSIDSEGILHRFSHSMLEIMNSYTRDELEQKNGNITLNMKTIYFMDGWVKCVK